MKTYSQELLTQSEPSIYVGLLNTQGLGYSIVYSTNGEKFYYSNGLPNNNNGIRFRGIVGKYVFASCSDNASNQGLYRSSDGKNFERVTTLRVTSFTCFENKIFACDNASLPAVMSIDGGETFTNFNVPYATESLGFINDTLVASPLDATVIPKYTKNYTSWTNTTGIPVNISSRAFSINSPTLICISSRSSANIYKSTDGVSFSTVDTGVTSTRTTAPTFVNGLYCILGGAINLSRYTLDFSVFSTFNEPAKLSFINYFDDKYTFLASGWTGYRYESTDPSGPWVNKPDYTVDGISVNYLVTSVYKFISS